MSAAPLRDRVRSALRWLVTVGMVGIGVLHFVKPEPFLAIMPPFIPFHLAMVLVSGAAEIALGLALAPQRTRRWASFGVKALEVAVCPANLYLAIAGVSPTGEPIPAWVAWGRLPLQPLLILLAGWVGRDGLQLATGRGAAA
ncbi:MAG: DoxX family protein [Deltaproteobacteria bacterium]